MPIEARATGIEARATGTEAHVTGIEAHVTSIEAHVTSTYFRESRRACIMSLSIDFGVCENMRSVSVVAAAVILTGCYVYHPITTNAASTGKYVRAELTDVGSTSVAPAIGTNAIWVEGEVQEASDARLTITLRAVSRRDMGESTWNGETVSLNAGDIRTLQERVLSRGRTATTVSLLSAGGIGVIYAIAHATGLVSGSSGRTPPPPP